MRLRDPQAGRLSRRLAAGADDLEVVAEEKMMLTDERRAAAVLPFDRTP
jgi:hypothetical protein